MGVTTTHKIKHTTAAGSVHLVSGEDFGRCTIVMYPPAFVWSRLQELHRASLRKPDAKHLHPARARSYYDAVRVASISQLWVGSDATRAGWFNQLLEAIAKARSFDGLETAFLSGLNTAGAAGQHDAVKRAVHLWHSYGPPAKLGGGHKRSPVLDTKRNAIAFIDHAGLASLGPKGKHAGIISPKASDLAGAVQGAGIFDAAVAQDGDACEKYFKAGGALVGGSLGALAGTAVTAPGGPAAVGGFVTGMLAGGAAGATIGGALGGALCPGVMEGGGQADVTGGAGGEGGSGSSPSDSIMFGSGDESGDSGGQSSEQNQSSQDEGQSSQDSSNQSSSDDNSSSNQSGGDGDSSGSGSGNDNSGGMPDPDDPHGFPSPDDPHGRSLISDTCAYGSVASHMALTGGAFTFQSVPRLAADGTVASAGFLTAVPGVADKLNAQQSTVVDQGLAGTTMHPVGTP